jgi:cytochrome c-type biogenesis protein CcmH
MNARADRQIVSQRSGLPFRAIGRRIAIEVFIMFGPLLIAMTVLAALLTLWPLILRKSIAENASSEMDFYKGQLSDIERDIERGLLPSAEAEASRTEIARRLLGLQKEQGFFKPFQDNATQRKLALLLGLVVLPVVGVGLYGIYGNPTLKDMPLASREDLGNESQAIAKAVARIEADLAAAPDNLKAWSTLAPVYMRLGRFQDAVTAYGKILALTGEDAMLRALLGEAKVAAANGIITDEAKQDFLKAIAKDPSVAMAQFYLGLAVEQAGDTAKAIALYEALLDTVADRPQWVTAIKARLAKLKGEPPAPAGTQADQEMILGMVSRLAARLEKDGGTAEEWERLIRSYVVLGKHDDAEQALTKARAALKADQGATHLLQSLAHETGLSWR